MEDIGLSLIIAIVITLIMSAFFSGMEIAFVSSNRMLAEMDKERKGITASILSRFYSHPNGFVSTMLVGNNIVLVVYGILFARYHIYGVLYCETLLSPECISSKTIISFWTIWAGDNSEYFTIKRTVTLVTENTPKDFAQAVILKIVLETWSINIKPQQKIHKLQSE